MERPLQERFKVGEWTVEPRLNQIRRGEEIRQLDPRIMDVLVCLAGRPGQGITKDELLDAVWGDVFVAENTLSQAVSRLRKALGDDWRDPAYIKTISKTGYRLVAPVHQEPRPTVSEGAREAPEGSAMGVRSSGLPHASRAGADGRALETDLRESGGGSFKASSALNPAPQEDTGGGRGPRAEIPSRSSASWRSWIPAALSIAVLAATALLMWRTDWAPHAALPLQGRPLVTLLGQEAAAALSPDGTGVAFAWGGPEGDNWDIYLKLVDGDQPQRLTQGPGPEVLPAWSPDGRFLAFVRRSPEGECEIARLPAIGGPAERLGDCRPNPRQMAWSDDGRWLAFAAHQSPDSNASRIYLLEVAPPLRGAVAVAAEPRPGQGRRSQEKGAKQPGAKGDKATCISCPSTGRGEAAPFPLTFPPQGSFDARPAFSPDGRLVTFQRQGSGRHYQLMSVPLPGMGPVTPSQAAFGQSGGGQPQSSEEGNPQQLYHEPGVRIVGHDWTPEGQIILSLDRAGRPDLWRFDPDSRQLGERLTAGSAWVSIPRTARRGRRMVYDAISDVTHLYALHLEAPGKTAGAPRPLLNSTRSQRSARPSPDGSRIAFLSDRSGSMELWSGDAPGSKHPGTPNLIRHTDFKAPLIGAPSWSPDGKQLIFDAYLYGQADLFGVGRQSRSVQRLTEAESNEVNPAFSADGQWIYFASDRSGSWQVHRKPVQGGDTQQVTQQGGFRPLEHPLQEGWLYSRYAPTTLWHVSKSLEPELGHSPLSRESAPLGRRTALGPQSLALHGSSWQSPTEVLGMQPASLRSSAPNGIAPMSRVSRGIGDPQATNQSLASDALRRGVIASRFERLHSDVLKSASLRGRTAVIKYPHTPLQTSSAGPLALLTSSGDTPSAPDAWKEELIGGPLAPWDWGNWTVNRDGFYAVGRNPARIDFYPFPDGSPKATVLQLEKQIPTGFPCLSISPDGRTLYFTLIEQSEDEIILADY